ncbi:MAG: CoA transferase [Proteobacteria bacterium]|nr:CoA transferase [Pseudomonadota bacterium]
MPDPAPLRGLTVVDLSRVLAGPYCTMLLADLGARVIKVERPGSGDDARGIGPFVAGRSAYFASLNRGKQSIALDLKQPADRDVFERLLERADVLVENYRPGTLERLGYDWETLHQRFPRLVLASVSGFGQTGPYRERPSYDLIAQAMGGIMSLTGLPGDPPVRVGTSVGDIAAGLFAALGIQSALLERQRSGLGRRVDVAMLDCQIAILENAIARCAATGSAPEPLGSRHPSITPFDAFRTATRPIVIAAGNDRLFHQLCACLGRPALADDPDFSDNDRRSRNHEALKRALEEVLCTRPAERWLDELERAGIPCGPINDVAQALADPQVRARNMVVRADDPVSGRLEMAGNPIKLSEVADPETRRPAPELDADREAILRELTSGGPNS